MSFIKLLVADDHNLIRNGLCALLKLEPDFQVVGEATSGREAVSMAEKLSPHVVIMDLAMPLLNGVEATRQLLRAQPDTKVIVLSAYDDDGHVEAVLGAGASAYLLKITSATEISRAVREVYKGNAYFSPTIAERLRTKSAEKLKCGEATPLAPQLTSRETEVWQLIAEGFSNKQIASELSVSVKTVEKHRQSLMAKLNIHCTADLTRHAARKGIIEAGSAKRIFSKVA
jgi:DNA-binding NarL/FixJ family response regulator